jgi:parallel beta-helix repeat protein
MKKSLVYSLAYTLALCVVILALGCSKKEQIKEYNMQTLENDTTWQGTVHVNGDIYVPPGVTLTVLPGTTVKFKRIDEKSDQNMFDIDSPYYPEAELIVRGKIIAKGTEKDKIVFTSMEIDARPKDWGAINLLGSDGNIFEHCKILFAYNGIHGHGSSAEIRHNEFAKNGVGISFKMEEETKDAPWFGKVSNMVITDNRFYKNKGGIGFRNSKGEISHNLIEDNKFFGIFPKEKAEALISYNEVTGNKKGIYLYQAQGVKLANNNIYDNKDYNIAVAEAQDFDVEARNKWFGTIKKEKIEEMIFYQGDDVDLGKVNFEPFLKKRVKWEL